MTPHQEALAASVSEPAKGSEDPAFPDLRIEGPQVFDASAMFDAVRRAADGTDSAETRAATVRVLREALDRGRDVIETAIGENPMAARDAVRAYCFLTDGIVTTVYRVASELLHPNPSPTEGERLAIVAVGGYGRGEMAPYSDVDLLFLMPWKVTPWAESLIESMLYMFWDLHLKVGHASRSRPKSAGRPWPSNRHLSAAGPQSMAEV